MKPILKKEHDIAELIKKYPVKLRSFNKKLLWSLSKPNRYEGKMIFSRYQCLKLPTFCFNRGTKDREQINIYNYKPYDVMEHVDWHVNFADPYVFGYYGGELYAQDEHQVSEHPQLGNIREWLNKENINGSTVFKGRPTPVLISGVPRRLNVDTSKGIYGNAFSRTNPYKIKECVTVLNPPTLSNIIAMTSIDCGRGKYTYEEIEYLFLTAYTAFKATIEESKPFKAFRRNYSKGVVIHTVIGVVVHMVVQDN